MLEAARDLYGLTPAEFTAARNSLAKKLKAEGEADNAAIIAKLRKPRLAEHALNLVARADPAIVGRFADSVSGAQRAQAAAIGGDAGALRDATNELRQANNAVVDAAIHALSADGGNGEAQRDDLVGLLREFISGANPMLLVAGVVGSEALIAAGEMFRGAPDPPDDLSARRAQKAARAAAERAPAAAKPAKPDESRAAARRAMQRAERTRLKELVAGADRAVKVAGAAVEATQQQLLERRADLKAAQAAAKSAGRELAAFDPDES